MEELLIPTEGDESNSNNGSFSPKDSGENMLEWVKNLLRGSSAVSFREWLKDYCKRNGLLALSVFAVVTGCILGFMLRNQNLSTQAKIYFSFPGELLMRILKMLILPLITSSLMSGLSSMDSKACGRMGLLTVTYYLWTTFIAVVVGIILVLIIHPGTGTEMEGHRLGGGPYSTDLVPVLKTTTKTIEPNYVYIMPDENNPKVGRPVFLELTPAPDILYKGVPGSSKQMNVLGIVIFSATMGLLLGKMGERGAPLVNVCQCINECVMKIINAAVW
ncbi:hypothetical protein JZ751_024682 [Albula glossodonta]|uniref:Amino acid transporter n=1 Tax=Albula glossodonta TaxID=121402 RepID=A0A8T2PBN4_9TELE|nr:hypothetical protein JZ751_024682 [Albula glossodonta]